MRPIRVEIVGVIGAGKSTISKKFAAKSNEWISLTEKPEQNPYWDNAYASKEYAFEKDITFLLDHSYQIKRESSTGANLICDFSLIQDLVYAEMGNHGQAMDTYLKVHQYIRQNLDHPDAIVRLTCASEIILERIKRRGRIAEQNIQRVFIDELDENISISLSSLPDLMHQTTINTDELSVEETVHALEKELLKMEFPKWKS